MQTVLSECLDSDGGGVHLTVIFVVIHEKLYWHVLMALDCPQDVSTTELASATSRFAQSNSFLSLHLNNLWPQANFWKSKVVCSYSLGWICHQLAGTDWCTNEEQALWVFCHSCASNPFHFSSVAGHVIHLIPYNLTYIIIWFMHILSTEIN